MITYPHPLDYVVGLKYAVLDEKIPASYSMSPETFTVEELVDFTSLGFNKEQGEYIVLRVAKRDLETFKAVSIVSKILDIPRENLYYYGLKDKNAYTVSYLFVKSKLVDQRSLPIIRDNLSVELYGFIRVKPRSIHFMGNRFKVYIEPSREDVIFKLKEIVKKLEDTGLPSYYGYQRFGTRRYNTHLLGKLIIQNREDLFSHYFLRALYPLEEIDATIDRLSRDYKRLYYESIYVKSRKPVSHIVALKELGDLFIDAYASYLYNLLLNTIIEKEGFSHLDRKLPMPGCIWSFDLYGEILEHEELDQHSISKLPCFSRDGLFRPLNNAIYSERGFVIYDFTLKPGMYASIVLRELFKDGLILND